MGGVTELLLHLANGSLEGASPRVVDVVVVLDEGTLVAGYPSKISLGGESGLVLTAHGALPTLGDDHVVDPARIAWAWATSDDGSSATFGAPGADLARTLGERLDVAKRDDPRGADATRLAIALGAIAHAAGEVRVADRHYRTAMLGLVTTGSPRAQGDLWMRLVALYADMGDTDSLRMAAEQAVATYTSTLGDEHPITAHARAALGRTPLIAGPAKSATASSGERPVAPKAGAANTGGDGSLPAQRAPGSGYSPVPLILFLLALAGVAALVVLRGRHEDTAPPAPAAISPIAHCYASDLGLGADGTASIRVSMSDTNFVPTQRYGTLQVRVNHVEPPNPDPAKRSGLPESTTVCEMSGPVTAASYGDAGARVVAKLDKPCGTALPAGRVVQIAGSFAEGDASSGSYCEYVDKVPAALGGRDMTVEEQSAELFRASAERDAPAAFASIRAYLDTLVRLADAVDPSRAPTTKACPTEVEGAAAVFGYEVLARVVGPRRDGGALRAPVIDPTKVMYSDLVSSSASAVLLARAWATPDNVAALAPRLERLGRWVIVLTSLDAVDPIVDIPERMAGQSVVEARFTPGSYRGGLFVLDREAATVACAAPVSATNHVDKIESKDPNELHRAARANLAFAVQGDWRAKLASIAPRLSPEKD